MAPHLIFYLLKALSILSGKIRSERAFPGRYDLMLFLVTKNCRVQQCTCMMMLSRNFCIANEGDSEQEASRQNLKSIEICFNSSHHGKIALYLDRIHQYLCPVKSL